MKSSSQPGDLDSQTDSQARRTSAVRHGPGVTSYSHLVRICRGFERSGPGETATADSFNPMVAGSSPARLIQRNPCFAGLFFVMVASQMSSDPGTISLPALSAAGASSLRVCAGVPSQSVEALPGESAGHQANRQAERGVTRNAARLGTPGAGRSASRWRLRLRGTTSPAAHGA